MAGKTVGQAERQARRDNILVPMLSSLSLSLPFLSLPRSRWALRAGRIIRHVSCGTYHTAPSQRTYLPTAPPPSSTEQLLSLCLACFASLPFQPYLPSAAFCFILSTLAHRLTTAFAASSKNDPCTRTPGHTTTSQGEARQGRRAQTGQPKHARQEAERRTEPAPPPPSPPNVLLSWPRLSRLGTTEKKGGKERKIFNKQFSYN